MKRYSKDIKQSDRIESMLKCDFNKVARKFIEITLQHICFTVNMLHISKRAFYKNRCG